MTGTELDPQLPRPGSQVEFACGGVAPLEVNTPTAVHEGKLIYFCLPACKRTFDQDPERFLSGAIPHFEGL